MAAKWLKKKHNLDVLVTFTDYVTPNAALDDGSIDANAFQHKPYLDQQLLTVVTNWHRRATPLFTQSRATQNKSKSLMSYKTARIAVPNDPTNLGRSLLLLQQQGLLKLREDVGLLATVRDIVGKSKNFILRMDAAQLPRSLDDVALSIINTTYASSINLTPEKTASSLKTKSPYVNPLVAREAM